MIKMSNIFDNRMNRKKYQITCKDVLCSFHGEFSPVLTELFEIKYFTLSLIFIEINSEQNY